MSDVPVVGFDMFTATSESESNAAWAAARRAAPVVRTGNDDGLWLLTRHEEVCTAFRDWERFSSARTDPEVAAITVSKARIPLLVPQEMDPPEWFPLRRVLAELLTPALSQGLRPRVRHWVSRHLDGVVAAGRADLVTDLTVPVPAAVTMELLGFPEEEWLPLASLFHDVSAYPPGHEVREAAIGRYPQLYEATLREIQVRRTEVRDDAIGRMVAALDGTTDDMTIAALVIEVMGGGVDTTTALTSAALVHLGRDVELRARLRHDPTLLAPATEEFLRMYPPARSFARTITTDTELAGCPLPKGDRVVLSQISANFDEQAFPDPDTFQPERFPNRHVSFGMGIHRCPGSHLARIMFAEMVTGVLERMPDYELEEAGLVEYPYWGAIGGWAHVPVTCRPAG